MGWIAQVKWPIIIKKIFFTYFVNRYRIDLTESVIEKAWDFKTLDDLFTRKLKSQARTVAESIIVHPCDSQLTFFEKIEENFYIQVKKVPYQIARLVKPFSANGYINGRVGVYYLCPTDYHRVHSPVDGYVTQIAYIPGAYWPVNYWSTKNIDHLFYKNERVLFEIQTPRGPLVLIMVGAINVGKISTPLWPELQNSIQKKSVPDVLNFEKPISINKGQELGIFHLGSTVVMCYSEEFTIKSGLLDKPQPLDLVKLGQGYEGIGIP